MSARLAALTAALALTAFAPPALAADCPKTSLSGIENEVMCLVCGVPLALADAPQAQRERAFITRMIRQCRSKDEIEHTLVAQYGPSVLALPSPSGFRLAAYLVPGLGAAAAAACIGLVWTRRRHHGRAGDHRAIANPPPLDPRDAARLDTELEHHRSAG